ncbi:MAG: hypothetical protein BWY43_00148 [candidate division WS2 bacterium ADurb.Bin280]|uniref:Uncharacterized protein n=1 Tax=candidate division WS2 bacterium ADurb.Bin280 TaxID=1852829 RepID=A0A1V5SGB5_9BACT|nr:MAG: hypothetical protein BWY43_00148 [candidate division WS2 bacterium ADurb.Bin280]
MVSANIKLKYHSHPINEFTEIDKYLMVPKKLHEDFPEGEIEIRLQNKKFSTRVYDIYCECTGSKHIHKVIDLRKFEGTNDFSEGEEIEIS